jgi:cytochrome c-type biogenesis protein CcmF
MLAVSALLRARVRGARQPVCRRPGGAPTFEGQGHQPLLQDHILVPFHSRRSSISTVAFAFAVAALITDRVDKGWPIETRRWALFAWGFLTIGILLGGWWS